MTRSWEKERKALAPTPRFDQPIRLLYFTAKWCGPCKAFRPRLVSWLGKAGLLTAMREIDVDSVEGHALADQYRVTHMPTVIAIYWPDSAEAPLALGSLRGAVGEKEFDRFLAVAKAKAAAAGDES